RPAVAAAAQGWLREPASPRLPAARLTRCEAGADGESPDGRGRPAARRAACPPRRSRARGLGRDPRDRGAPVNGTESDLMARAVALGEHGRRCAPPNPWVGCVVVDEQGEIAGGGWHEGPGTPHAEATALAAAGERARGGAAFVTLDACAQHGRPPPCADALITSGVRRVEVALEDPDPRVAGRGLARLRAAGVDVRIGPGAVHARRSLAPYLRHRRTGRAWCLMKTAMSLDARVAAADGSARWITGPAARADAHPIRAEPQAALVGARTAPPLPPPAT